MDKERDITPYAIDDYIKLRERLKALYRIWKLEKLTLDVGHFMKRR